MAVSNRPGVYASYEVSSSIAGSGNGSAVGVAATADIATPGSIFTVNSYAEAAALFGADSNITKLIRILFLNGAPVAVAAPVPPNPDTAAYTLAFDALKTDESIKIVVCDSREATVRTAFFDAINSAPENCKFRIGIMDGGDFSGSSRSTADSFNSERVIVTAPSAKALPTGSVPAALAGVIAASSDPALPLNGAVLRGISELSGSFSDADISQLINGGVTAVERSGSRVLVVRGITSRTKTGGSPDTTWKELSTTLIADDVVSTLRNSLRARFSRTKNTAQTRGAIRTQVIIELENKKTREIIDDYGNVSVSAKPEDPTVCEVFFEFTVAHGLNQIFLSANITV